MDFFSQINHMKKNNKAFLIYGYVTAENIERIIDSLDITIAGCIDDDPIKQGTKGTYGNIISFSEIEDQGVQNNYNYIVVVDYVISLRRKLENAGVPKNQVIWMNIGEFGTWVNDPSYMVDHYEEFRSNEVIFADEKSKDQYREMCRFRMDFNENRLYKIDINAYDQYFDDVVKFTDDEVFVDIGTYDGRTIEEFISRVKGKYKKIIAVEASLENMQLAKKRLQNYNNIEYLQYAISDSDTEKEVSFDGNCGPNSKVDVLGSEKVVTVSLDHLLDEEVTYIKMDIEGAERMALSGMKRLVKKYRPKLAVSIYHSSEDMLYLPQMLKEMCEDYCLYFRQHSEGIGESICYAIPYKSKF